MRGTSPHTRGSPGIPRRVQTGEGNIPAYAGITRGLPPTSRPRREHPRIRGDHLFLLTSTISYLGTSPHTRGSPKAVFIGGSRYGNIPAYAGITAWTRWETSSTREHPRIRGDHGRSTTGHATYEGTSPHTRGSRRFLFFLRFPAGNIPAYAGITGPGRIRIPGRWEHPRIRGDHQTIVDCCDTTLGTSPHTRGSLEASPFGANVVGNIPAYAGITSSSRPSRRFAWEHPRIRGDHNTNGDGKPGDPGTSPHTRGSPRDYADKNGFKGNIPAYAGITHSARSAKPPYWEHPRIRGDHDGSGSVTASAWGTSPHTRGSRRLGQRHGFRVGNIPAYAGITCSRGSPRASRREHPRIRGDHCQ